MYYFVEILQTVLLAILLEDLIIFHGLQILIILAFDWILNLKIAHLIVKWIFLRLYFILLLILQSWCVFIRVRHHDRTQLLLVTFRIFYLKQFVVFILILVFFKRSLWILLRFLYLLVLSQHGLDLVELCLQVFLH